MQTASPTRNRIAAGRNLLLTLAFLDLVAYQRVVDNNQPKQP